jgi:hypothetical protein
LFFDSKLKPKGRRLTLRDDIIQNGFNHPKFDTNASILMLMPHKFVVNASNFVLMPKKTGGGDHYNFTFS